MITCRAKALGPALMLLVALAEPPASADTAGDCAILNRAAGEYSKLSERLSRLRKTADEQEDDAAALTATQRAIVELARAMGARLHMLQVQLDNPLLAYVYQTDSKSFYDYANTLEGAVNSGDIAGANIHVITSYNRNVASTEAANDAYHEKCK